MKVYKTIEEALVEWEVEETLGNPRFSLKHALRLQGLFLGDDDKIYDSRGKLYATLGEVKWLNEAIIEAKVKLVQSIKFIPITIDIGKLK